MEIKIDADGDLEIMRAGQWKKQECAFTSATGHGYCGDRCPLFEEPVYPAGPESHILHLCLKEIDGSVADERVRT